MSMFSSYFSSAVVDPTAPNFHPVSSAHSASDLFGELEPKDTEWTCAGGFAVETQVFYQFLEDGTLLLFQIIHSAVGVWYPAIHINAKIYNPNTKETIWRSIHVTNFVTPPPNLDKRSCKGDQFSITHKSAPGTATPESYVIRANLADDLQVSIDVARPAEAKGWKLGKGPKGGFSYFGPDVENPESYVVHRFWPRTHTSGVVVHKGQVLDVKGDGMFVHAIQGMRPNLVASRWSFANFQSKELGGVSAVQMEFTTTDSYGRKGSGSGFVKVNVGSLVVGDKLVAVTGETRWPDEEASEDAPVKSRAVQSKTAHDPETEYETPAEIVFRWAGPSVVAEAPGSVDGTLTIDVGTPDAPKGLVEKVDVLAEIPKVIKTMVNVVAGTKPYVYQYMNPATLRLTGPAELLSGATEATVEGTLFNEASFIS